LSRCYSMISPAATISQPGPVFDSAANNGQCVRVTLLIEPRRASIGPSFPNPQRAFVTFETEEHLRACTQ
jgi:hypothetical protein